MIGELGRIRKEAVVVSRETYGSNLSGETERHDVRLRWNSLTRSTNHSAETRPSLNATNADIFCKHRGITPQKLVNLNAGQLYKEFTFYYPVLKCFLLRTGRTKCERLPESERTILSSSSDKWRNIYNIYLKCQR